MSQKYEANNSIKITKTFMPDGRELIYFDDENTQLAPARKTDTRQLDPRPKHSTMRYDALTGEWVAVATQRNNRVFLPPAHLDPLAPATPENPSEIPDNYDVVVFENKSPSFGPQNITQIGTSPAEYEQEKHPVASSLPGIGRCEVVCFSPDTEGSLADLGTNRMRTVMEAWVNRSAELSKIPGVKQVFIFENRGEEIGVTLHHPHGQIYAYPFITPKTQKLIQQAQKYEGKLFEDIKEEAVNSSRVLINTKYWVAFVPYAARWPIEVHVLPHRNIGNIHETSIEERNDFSELYLQILKSYDLLYNRKAPYIAAWHQRPVHDNSDDITLMLQITSPLRAKDKLKYLAGSESAMGAWISDVSPEKTADSLKQKLAYNTTKQQFIASRNYEPDALYSAPGRINLIGEHTDYNNGYVLPTTINLRTWLAVAKRTDHKITLSSSHYLNEQNSIIETDISQLHNAKQYGWAAYPLGVYQILQEKFPEKITTGVDIHIHSEVPLGGGLSSSAALESATLKALLGVYGIDLSNIEQAKICQQAENTVVGAPTGIMDQTVVINGEEKSAVFIDCETNEIEKIFLNLEPFDLEIIVIDTTVKHQLNDGGYGSRRAECESAAQKMGVASLRQSTVQLLENTASLSPKEYARAKHVIAENNRVLLAVEAIKNENWNELSYLFAQSHASLRDDFEVSCAELDLAVDSAVKNGALAARMTGGGFGGSAIAIVPKNMRMQIKAAIENAFVIAAFAQPKIFQVEASAGARKE